MKLSFLDCQDLIGLALSPSQDQREPTVPVLGRVHTLTTGVEVVASSPTTVGPEVGVWCSASDAETKGETRTKRPLVSRGGGSQKDPGLDRVDFAVDGVGGSRWLLMRRKAPGISKESGQVRLHRERGLGEGCHLCKRKCLLSGTLGSRWPGL